MIIEGPAGVGKTRLLDAAHGLAQDEGYRVLGARAGEREREYSWGTVRSLFEPILIASDEDELEELWAGPAAAGRSLLEGTVAPSEGTAATAPSRSSTASTGSSRRLADRQPLLLAIDDLHWVDGASLGFLEFLSRRIGEHAGRARRNPAAERARLRLDGDRGARGRAARGLRPAPAALPRGLGRGADASASASRQARPCCGRATTSPAATRCC